METKTGHTLGEESQRDTRSGTTRRVFFRAARGLTVGSVLLHTKNFGQRVARADGVFSIEGNESQLSVDVRMDALSFVDRCPSPPISRLLKTRKNPGAIIFWRWVAGSVVLQDLGLSNWKSFYRYLQRSLHHADL